MDNNLDKLNLEQDGNQVSDNQNHETQEGTTEDQTIIREANSEDTASENSYKTEPIVMDEPVDTPITAEYIDTEEQPNPSQQLGYTDPPQGFTHPSQEPIVEYQQTDAAPFSESPQQSPPPAYSADILSEKKYEWDYSYYQTPNQSEPAKPAKKNKGLVIFATVMSVFFVLTAGAFAFYVISTAGYFNKPETDLKGAESGTELVIKDKPSAEDSTKEDGKLTAVGVAKKVKPSVVGVVTYNLKQGLKASSQGSGIVMSADGYIVTNAHVVAGADAVKIVLSDNEEYEGKIVGVDERTDLAVVKIEAKNLVAADFGDSATLEAGETVLAIGNPNGLNLAGSITQGIISAMDRTVESDSAYATSFIQTDAAINPGNSGGALVDEYGFVVGINTAKIAATEFEGIGFAIPINEAKPVVDSLIKHGYVKDRSRIGVTYVSIDETLAKLNDIPSGMYVASIDETTDVAKKIKVYDIITAIDGEKVIAAKEINALLKTKKPGDTIKLSVYRFSDTGKGSTFEVDVVLAEDKGTLPIVEQPKRQDENNFQIFP